MSVSPSSPSESCIRILIVDDYNLVRQGLRLVLSQFAEIRVVGEAWSGAQAVEVAQSEQPDIILLDLELGADSGLDFLPRLLEVSAARVIVFTGISDAQIHHQALALGAKAVAVKGDETEVLLDCIRRTYAGETLQFEPEAAKIAKLEKPEREFIDLLCEGTKNQEIGEQIGVGASDFKQRLASVEKKLGVSGPVELVVYAFRHGLAKSH